MMARGLVMIPRLLTPVALVAALLAIIVPSATAASRSDLLLAVLVLATALGISHHDLARLRSHVGAVAFLSVVPMIVLAMLAWAIGRPFSPPIRVGLLGVGLSSSEVASVGLVALAGADATIALGVVTGSLVVAALAGPLAIGWLGGGHADAVALLGRFALVVIGPLCCGVLVRSVGPRLAVLDGEREGVAALAVAALVYAALSGTHGAHHLGAATLASAVFLAVSALLGELWRRRRGADRRRGDGGGGGDGARGDGGDGGGGDGGGGDGARGDGGDGGGGDGGGVDDAIPGALTIAMRDFAVAAALATQAFGTAAGAVPGVYGVLMLVAGTVAAGRLRPPPPRL